VTRPPEPPDSLAPLACARVRVLLEAYVDGDLAAGNPKGAAEVRAHLATCDDCRRQHDQAVSLPFRLKALASPTPPASLVAGVMNSIAPVRRTSRRAWTLLAPEAVLVAFIVWYLSGLDGLASLTAGTWSDLQTLAGWGAGTSPLPSIPVADVLLLAALIALTAIAAYHLSVLARLSDGGNRRATGAMHEHYRA
jgi:predicted anti-sigma-YlaC factor YlaD